MDRGQRVCEGNLMQPRHILLIEDNSDDVELTLRAMRSHAIEEEVRVARDGAEALEMLYGETQAPARPALILLDLNLPKIDGFEVLRRIRSDEHTSHLPVVILTTSREERDILSSYELGANSYIHKPVDYHTFSDAIRQLGLYWLRLNITPWKQ
jgi:two-component system, response regulator